MDCGDTQEEELVAPVTILTHIGCTVVQEVHSVSPVVAAKVLKEQVVHIVPGAAA